MRLRKQQNRKEKEWLSKMKGTNQKLGRSNRKKITDEPARKVQNKEQIKEQQQQNNNRTTTEQQQNNNRTTKEQQQQQKNNNEQTETIYQKNNDIDNGKMTDSLDDKTSSADSFGPRSHDDERLLWRTRSVRAHSTNKHITVAG